MYDAQIGRFIKQDAFSPIYERQSQYAYVANNPINYVDVNGDYILPDDAITKFPRLAQYLQNGIQDILKNGRIINAMKKYGGFSDQQLQTVFSWQKGPEIHVFDLGTTKFDDGKEIEALGFTSNWELGVGIDIDWVKKLETAEGKERDQFLFLIAVTILHETTHWGFDLNELEKSAAEEGILFERKAYGKTVTTDNFRQVFDQNQQRQKTTGSSSSNSFDNFFSGGVGGSNGGGTNSSSTMRRIKSSEPNADRAAARRSGGAH
ncbi:MAG: RHS repeat-associated core domain-containing protein [Chryseolinea sp.]